MVTLHLIFITIVALAVAYTYVMVKGFEVLS